ncbi:MAG: hypothetical protein GX131_14150 [candidate division WS1 bacterium]|jgi:hypothetical protein|nr:hypothetical protein [candidate division WS1 bacterium]
MICHLFVRQQATICGLICLALAICLPVGADDPREAAVVTLRSGGLMIELQQAHAWNIQRILYQGGEVGSCTGAYGLVACIPAAGGWVGSAHTEGGIEQVQEVGLIVDGERAELADGAVYTGERIVLTKRSMLDKLQLEAMLVLDSGTLIQRHELSATEDIIVTTLYPFMYCITAETRRWLASTSGGEEQSGTFASGRELEWHEDWDWTATYLPEQRTGVVLRHLSVTDGAQTFTGYWDTERYHKLYVKWVPEQTTWREGQRLRGEVALRCYEAPPADWESVARATAAGLVGE